MYIDRKVYNYDTVMSEPRATAAEKALVKGVRMAREAVESAEADEDFEISDDDTPMIDRMRAEIRKEAYQRIKGILESTETEACASVLDQYPEE